jgi:hypothetical protein
MAKALRAGVIARSSCSNPRLAQAGADLDVAATTVRTIRMAILGADVPPPLAMLEVARRHADLMSDLDDDRRFDVAPAVRREERVEVRRRWRGYHGRLLADPEATLSLGE